MDNFLAYSQKEYESFILYPVDEEQRKVHTPYVQPQDISQKNFQSIKPISSKIQFTLNDIAMTKKAKSRKTKTVEDPNSSKKCGHWSSDENKRYHWFLELHHEHFFNKHLRRTDRIFKSMATFVDTREAEQCRSHHQKMEKKYKYFSKILMSLRLQNYNSDENQVILYDMEEKGHNIEKINILSADELIRYSESQSSQQKQNETVQIRTPKSKSIKSQNTNTTIPYITPNVYEMEEEDNKQLDHHSIFGQYFQVKHEIDNIFNDTYEKNIDLGAFF